jgi:hypothetical protein
MAIGKFRISFPPKRTHIVLCEFDVHGDVVFGMWQ